MTNERIEGTFFLDGLVEGPAPADEEARDRLEAWIAAARSGGISLALEVDGGHMSLLGDDTPRPVGGPGVPLEDHIAHLLEQLFDVYDPGPPPQLFSTLRSVEYRPNEEIQTLYGIQPDGTVRHESRTVPVQTKAPPERLSTREQLKLAGIGLGAAAVLFGLLMLIPSVRHTVASAVSQAGPVSADAIQVDAGPFASFLTVEHKAVRDLGATLVLRLAPTPAHRALLQRAADENAPAAGSLRRRVAETALVRGYLRCEYFDGEGTYVAHATVRLGQATVEEGEERPTFHLKLPLPPRYRIRTVRLVP